MLRIYNCVCTFVLLTCCVLPMAAQQPVSTSANATVPQVVNFSGVLTDGNKPVTGLVGVTFSLYKESQGGTALWMETQNVQVDKNGHYSAVLGSTTSHGLPADLFSSGEARWLGVEAQGRAEEQRVLLMSVPYALKALDAETIGGKPVSAFMLAPTTSSGASQHNPSPAANITGGGTAGFVPVFTGTTQIADSLLFQTVGKNIGIGTTTPTAKLDVKGTSDVRDTLTLFPKLTHPTLSVKGTAFEVSSTGKVTFVSGQTFPGTGTVTSVGSGAGLTGGPITGSGTLSIQTGGVTNAMLAHPSLTVNANGPLTGGGVVALGGTTSLGLTNSCSSGQILKWNGSSWACASDNNSGGTVTSVGSGLGLTGGPITGSGALKIDTTVVPQLAANNNFTGSESIAGSLTVGGVVFSNSDLDAASNVNAGFVSTSLGFLDSTNPNCGLAVVTLDNNFCSAAALEGDGTNTFINRPSGGAIEFLEANGSAEALIASGGELELFTGNARSIDAFNNSGSQTLQLNNAVAPSNSTFMEAEFNGNGTPVFFIDTLGDTNASGSKSAVVPLQSGEMVKVFSMESPEVWFEDFGSGHLAGGAVGVALDSKFTQTVNLAMGYHVFLTPKGDCKGLYVTGETNHGFEVRELGGGQSSVEFDYRIVAHRNGYEANRLPVAVMPVAGEKINAPKVPAVAPGTTANRALSAKLNATGTVIDKKK